MNHLCSSNLWTCPLPGLSSFADEWKKNLAFLVVLRILFRDNTILFRDNPLVKVLTT